MNSIISRFTTSLMSLLGDTACKTHADHRIAGIRRAMLDSISTVLVKGGVRPELWDRVEHAPSIQALWYLRCDLMNLLCTCRGEKLAGEQLATITRSFQGAVPRSQLRGLRPSAPLSSSALH